MLKVKTYLSANKLYDDSTLLAKKIWDSGFNPNFIVALWRGGTPPGIIIHEFLRVKFRQNGLPDPYSTAIKTQSYSGLQSSGTVEVKGLEHVIDVINSEDKLLLVDDVWDSGITMESVLKIIKEKARKNCPDIKVATVYFKPERNKTTFTPDFYQEINNEWIVFPHELDGLSEEDILKKSPRTYSLLYSN